MKRIYRNEDIDNIILDESLIVSISWKYENHPVIEMGIDWCGQMDMKDLEYSKLQTRLVFNFAGNIDFSFKHITGKWNSGALEITSFSYSYDKKGNYTVVFTFDYSPVGYIKFDCSEFYFEIIE